MYDWYLCARYYVNLAESAHITYGVLSLAVKGDSKTIMWKNTALTHSPGKVFGIVRFAKLKQPVFLVIDVFLVVMALFLSFLLRFGMDIPSTYVNVLLSILPLAIATKIPIFYIFGFYNQLWQYASLKEVLRLFRGISSSSLVFLVILFFTRQLGIPRAVLAIDWLLTLSIVGGSYFIIRARKDLFPTFNFAIKDVRQRRAIIIGAGDAGNMLAKQMQSNPEIGYLPVAFLDDDPSKIGLMIHGVAVDGNTKAISAAVSKYHADEVILAIPSAALKEKRRIALSCQEIGFSCKTVPDFSRLVRGEEDILQIRDIDPKELLGRKEVEIDLRDVIGCYTNRTILITGAAGSIGSEICRQVIDLKPAQVIATDIYENGLYHIEEEIKGLVNGNGRIFDIHIMDVRDQQAVDRIFDLYKPNIIFHAAAYKHVPMMEKHPLEAMENNVLGTEQMIKAAKHHGCERFIFVSTDKAVNPTSIMGLSKQFGEKAIKLASSETNTTKFMAVRFGNVLGSNGSVIPKFKRQIKNGEPITVTHEDITRYFMTIQEAVYLVTQAAAIGNGGEIFVLDMGDPVRILDLARSMVKLAGFEPGADIPITITGLRPGEKLFEELFNEDEVVDKTMHPQINLAFGNFNKAQVQQILDELHGLISAGNELKLIDFLHERCFGVYRRHAI